MKNLENKIIFLTGAGGALGAAALDAFAREGATVLATDFHDGDSAAAAVANVVASGGDVRYLPCGGADEHSLGRLMEVAMERFGRIDGAFNIGFDLKTSCNAADMTSEDFDRELDIRLRETFLCMRSELKIMRKQGSGAVVNLASIGGLEGLKDLVGFCAANFGIVGMTKVAAMDMAGSGVRVNCLCPGVWEGLPLASTPIAADAVERSLASIPLGRWPTHEELARMAMMLLSDHSTYVTGQSIVVDGGVTAGLTSV